MSKNKILIFVLSVVILGVGVFFIFKKEKKTEFFPQNQNEENSGSSPANLKWEKIVENASWSGRDAFGAEVFKNKIWLLGGVEGGKKKPPPAYEDIPHKSDIWFSDNAKNWQMAIDKAPWHDRRAMTLSVFKDKIWLIGGWEKRFGETKNDVWSSQDGVNWVIATNSASFEPREGHSTVVFKNKIWVLAGVNFFKRKTFNDVWYSEDGKKWTRAISEAPWSKRYDQTLVVFNDKLWLIGGLDFGDEVKKDVWVSEDGVKWELATENPPWPARHGHASFDFKGFLWIVGGWCEEKNKGALNDAWYSEDGYNWQKTKEDGLWTGREDHSVVVFKDKIWLMGGMAQEKEYWEWKNDIWSADF